MADMNRMLDNLAVVTNNPAFDGGSALLYTECSELIRLMNLLRDKGMVYLADLLQKLREENRSVTQAEWDKLHEFEAATKPKPPVGERPRPDNTLPPSESKAKAQAAIDRQRAAAKGKPPGTPGKPPAPPGKPAVPGKPAGTPGVGPGGTKPEAKK
jgi:hypothetical protein